MKGMKYWIVLMAGVLFPNVGFTQQPHQPSASEIQVRLKKLNFLGSVLYVAAHPDDENTRVITYFAKDRLAAAAYLSMTRGDGGQNLIGPEIGDKLGLIRTQELLAARRIDGGEQYFSRAVDFGYSKSAEETLKIWDRDAVLSDVVRVFRMFQPDVVLTRFPADERAGHGHHTSSAVLAAEAFDLAADQSKFPESAASFGVWKPRRLYTNTGRWWNNTINEDTPGIVSLDVGVYSPLLGMSASERAAVSRSQHKSQGFGSRGTRGYQPEFFEFVKGDQATKDFFEGINTSWSRVPGGDHIAQIVEAAIRDFDPDKPSASVPALLKIRKQIEGLDDHLWRTRKLKEVDQLIKDCLGLYVEVTASRYWVVPGESVELNMEIVNRSAVPVVLKGVHSVQVKADSVMETAAQDNRLIAWKRKVSIPDEAKYSGPYWLHEEHQQGLFEVSDASLIGRAEGDPVVSISFSFQVAGEMWSVETPVVYRWTDPVDGELYRPFEVVPKVTVASSTDVLVFSDANPREYTAKITSNSTNPVSGKVTLGVPNGWSVVPASVDFKLATAGKPQTVRFMITPPMDESAGHVEIIASVDGKMYTKSLEEVSYDHIPAQIIVKEARAHLVRLAIHKEGNLIGYIKGAGDEMPNGIRAMGYEVWEMNNEDITTENLTRLDAVVFGVRALNTNEQLPAFMPLVLQYAKNGGTVIFQYNTNNNSLPKDFSPYALNLSRNRVTEEDAMVTLLAKDHPALNTPNKISDRDFEGWVQERGLYFPDTWDAAFTPILQMNDKDEGPQKGSLLVARYGEGYFVYTGLSFFRQLPQGVPGAYRLFANLLSLGKPKPDKMAKGKTRKNR
jgi:LmbE family N-acetylglucosaminyl deacetylase